MKNDKNIAFFISSLAGGGSQRVCVNIVNGLIERGWNVSLVVLHLERAAYKSELNKKVNLVNLDVKNARHSGFKLYKYLKENNLSKVIAFNYELSVMLLIIRSLSHLNFIIISRNINSLSEKIKHHEGSLGSKILYFLMARIYKKSDHIINQCQAMKSDLLSVLPLVNGKCSVIYNPVNIKLKDSVYRESNLEGDYLLCVGRLEKQKAFHFAIIAFSKISKNYPKLRLKIVGEGSLKPELKKLCQTLEIEKNVDFEGFKSDMAPYYSNAKATLLTSLYEGFPNVLIESISLGTPIISFDCKSGPSEIVIDGENGYLINFKDVNCFSAAIDRLMNEDLLYEKVVQTSLRFENDTILDAWENLINDY